jgi:type IV pilus assembly protein PilM
MSESIWKKEITFRRKPKPEAAAATPVPAQPAKPETSIWKKEISFSRKRAGSPPVFAEPVQPQPMPQPAVAVPPPAMAPPPLVQPMQVQPPEPERFPVPAVPEAVPAPPVEAPRIEPVPMPAQQVEIRQLEPEPEPEPERWAPVPEPQLPPAQPVQVPLIEAAPMAMATPVPSPAAAPPAPAQPVEVLQPESAPWPTTREAAPPQPEELPQSVPAPAEPVQVQYAVPVVPAQVPAPWPAAAVPTQPVEVPQSEPQPATAPAPPAAAVPAPTAEPVQAETSIWKKELSFRRKPKKQAVARPASTAVTEVKPPPAREQVPLRKRGPSLSLPAPSFRRASGGHKAKRLVGLKIGASQVSAAHVSNNGAAELLKLAREPLEPGVVVAGEVRDPEALAEALKRFFARNKLPRKNVRLGIASNRIGVRMFELAGIEDEKQLENAIRFRAQETLPIPLDEAVLDYRVLSEHVDEAGSGSRRVLLVVAYRELVDRYVSACKKAGITLCGVDLEAFALLRSLAPPLPEEQQAESALVAVAIGHDRSTFAVSDGRVCEFTRVLDWGGSALSLGLARALDLTPSGVESIKRELSLDPSEPPEGMHPQHHAIALDALRRQVQTFARELVSSLQFYQHQPGSLPIGEIVITGGTASLGGFAGELQRLTGVRVRVGDPLARMKVAKRVQTEEPIGSLSVAIGLGIED